MYGTIELFVWDISKEDSSIAQYRWGDWTGEGWGKWYSGYIEHI